MDAQRSAGLLIAAATLLVATACISPPGAASPQPTQAPVQPPEPAQVVEQAPEPQDDVAKAIQDYLARLDATRANPPDIQTAADERPGPTTLPSQSPTSQPVIEAPEPAPTTAPSVSYEPEPVPQLAAPELRTVEVHATPEPVATATETADAPPGINAPAFARTSPTSLRGFLDEHPLPEQASFRDQLDRRMLWVVAGDYERARQPLDLVTAEQQALAARFVEAWIIVREWHMGDQAAGANAALRELEELQRALHRLSDLTIQEIRVCSAVRGFGQYDLLEPAAFPAGVANEFVLYCEVRGFVSEREDGLFTSRFDMTTTILDRSGQSVLELHDAELVDRCHNRRNDCFIPRLVRLPATLAPGQYTAKVSLIDKLGEKLAENRATFTLTAR